MGPARGPRERQRLPGVGLSVLCSNTWSQQLNSNNGSVQGGKHTRAGPEVEVISRAELGHSAPSLHSTCDFSHDCGAQSRKPPVSYLRHCGLSTCCLSVVDTLQLSPEARATHSPQVSPEPVWGRGGVLERLQARFLSMDHLKALAFAVPGARPP